MLETTATHRRADKAEVKLATELTRAFRRMQKNFSMTEMEFAVMKQDFKKIANLLGVNEELEKVTPAVHDIVVSGGEMVEDLLK